MQEVALAHCKPGISYKEAHLASAKKAVDGLIDMCVFAIGTLDAFGIDPHSAWSEVMLANITKEPGVKESRPNPLGLPDLIKPENWEGPDHRGNHGCLSNAL